MCRQTENDKQFMLRCIELAESAKGYTYPNPMVGSVIVHNGEIIGEGYHHKAGEPHAEVNAIRSVKRRDLLKDSTIYVSLEPCAHFGRTPPCAQLIIDTGIPRVVVGCVDTFSKVAGKGIEMLKNAGIDVTVGVLEEECRYLNRRFFTFHEKKRPYIILKWAESADGFVDTDRKNNSGPIWLTNEECRRLVHRQRTEEQAIMIGVNTANLDNPSLTARLWAGNQPTRFVIDPNLRIDKSLQLLNDGRKTMIINGLKNNTKGAVEYCFCDFTTKNGLSQILDILYAHEIQSVIVEGGTYTLNKFIEENLWDEAFVYKSRIVIGNGVPAPIFYNVPISVTDIGGVQLHKYKAI